MNFMNFFMKIRLNREMKMNSGLLNELNSEFGGAIHDVHLGALVIDQLIIYSCRYLPFSPRHFNFPEITSDLRASRLSQAAGHGSLRGQSKYGLDLHSNGHLATSSSG
jgi:hypothetical protein